MNFCFGYAADASGKLLRSFTLLICLVLTTFTSYSQGSMATGEPVSVYYEAVEDQLLLYNGVFYKIFPKPYLGSPFYQDDVWNVESVSFDNQRYDSIDLFYDTHRDVLVIEHYDPSGLPTFFIPDISKISFFTLNGDLFVTLPDSVQNRFSMGNGYYQLAHDGIASLYIKRKTTLHREQEDNKFILAFEPENKYYIRYNGEFHQVKTKGSVKRIFKDYKKEINAFVRNNNLLFYDPERDETLLLVTRFCDKLLKEGIE